MINNTVQDMYELSIRTAEMYLSPDDLLVFNELIVHLPQTSLKALVRICDTQSPEVAKYLLDVVEIYKQEKQRQKRMMLRKVNL